MHQVVHLYFIDSFYVRLVNYDLYLTEFTRILLIPLAVFLFFGGCR